MTRCGRVVFDTGALVGAALRVTSVADRALSLALRTGVVCLCEQSAESLRSVLRKPRFDTYMGRRARMAFVDVLLGNAWMCPLTDADWAKSRHSRRDPGSNLVLALAGVAEADVIVGSAPGLVARKVWRGIRIVTAAEFLDQFVQAGPTRIDQFARN